MLFQQGNNFVSPCFKANLHIAHCGRGHDKAKNIPNSGPWSFYTTLCNYKLFYNADRPAFAHPCADMHMASDFERFELPDV